MGEVGDSHVQEVIGLLGDRWPGVQGMGFVWGVCDGEVGGVREAHQGGEEGVGCVGRIGLLDCEGQGERHEKVQEGAFCSSLGDPAAWLQEGGEACSSADRVFAVADVARGEVVEGESLAVFTPLLEGARGCSGRLL